MEDWSRKIKNYRYALIGFPEDRGVKTNNGRPGAAQGPSEIRNHLDKAELKKWGLVDLGDTPPAETLLERQRLLGSMVRYGFERKLFPIVLGGGHETAFGHYLGYLAPQPPLLNKERGGAVRRRGEVYVLNIDAHLDCRPLVKGEGHSGSPFRQMIENSENRLPPENLIQFGTQQSCNSGENLQFAIEKKVQIFWLDQISKKGIDVSLQSILSEIKGPLYATIDLDGLAPSEFPATSAAPKMKDGFTIKEMEGIIDLLARHESLTSLDFCEFSPWHDPDGTAAKVVAMFLHRFLTQRLKS